MTRYKIVNTQKSDLDFIYWLFDEAIAYQKQNNYPVWPAYDKKVLDRDIEDNRQFKVLIDSGKYRNEIGCIFSIAYHDKIIWREKDNDISVYLHRIVVNPSFKGRRLFGDILSWCLQHIEEKQLQFIRMDTWADNPTLVGYYQSFGFKIIEYWTTPDSVDLPIQQRNNYVVLLEYQPK